MRKGYNGKYLAVNLTNVYSIKGTFTIQVKNLYLSKLLSLPLICLLVRNSVSLNKISR